MIIEDRILEIKEELDFYDDDLEKYEYIVDLGKALSEIDDNLLKDEFLVQGCSSKVWLIPIYNEGVLGFKAFSNSVIVKGLVSIVVNIFQDLNTDQIIKFDIEKLKQLQLSEIVSPTRQNGIYYMVKKIKHYAEIYGGNNES